MAFRNLEFDHLARFNSSVSSDFLAAYESYVDQKIIDESSSVPHRTFAPSSFRCDRLQWFRLRGVTPDVIKVPDRVLEFSADIGTACHRLIQNNLVGMLGDNWISVDKHVESLGKINYKCTSDPNSSETFVEIDDPPFRFACDGIVKLDDKFYLLEIKSSEYSSWNELTDPKQHHIDQVKCYCTLLDLDDVIFIYIDRQYGGLKFYEYHVHDYDKADIMMRVNNVISCVDSCLAPDPLPKGDSWCTSSMCPYYKKCSEYGR